MGVRVIGTKAIIRESPKPDSGVVGEVDPGDEIVLATSPKRRKPTWVQIRLPGDTVGYVLGEVVRRDSHDVGFAPAVANAGDDMGLAEALGAGAFAGLAAGAAAHYFAGGKLTFPIWMAASVLVLASVKNKVLATIVFVAVAAAVTGVLSTLAPA